MFDNFFASIGLLARGKTLLSPIEGVVVPLAQVPDDTFASGLLGEGVAIQPTGDRVVAPADAKIEAIFPTGHAVALHTVDGIDVLIHVGLETCVLEGRYFRVHAAPGDKVNKGDVLIEFDREAIEAEGYNLIAPVLVRNAAEFVSVKGNTGKHVSELDELLIAKGR